MDAPNLLESRLKGIVASSTCKPAPRDAKIRGPDDGSSTWYLASRKDSERLRRRPRDSKDHSAKQATSPAFRATRTPKGEPEGGLCFVAWRA